MLNWTHHQTLRLFISFTKCTYFLKRPMAMSEHVRSWLYRFECLNLELARRWCKDSWGWNILCWLEWKTNSTCFVCSILFTAMQILVWLCLIGDWWDTRHQLHQCHLVQYLSDSDNGYGWLGLGMPAVQVTPQSKPANQLCEETCFACWTNDIKYFACYFARYCALENTPNVLNVCLT